MKRFLQTCIFFCLGIGRMHGGVVNNASVLYATREPSSGYGHKFLTKKGELLFETAVFIIFALQ